MAVGYSSSKLVQHIGDGLAFMKEQRGQFDVIITDSSDPVGTLTVTCILYISSVSGRFRADGLLVVVIVVCYVDV